jgi:WD40 repeat protein
VTLAPSGRRALSCGNEGRIWLWDVESGIPLARFDGHEGNVNTVAFAPDGRRAISGGGDKSIRLWGLPKE